MPETAKEHGVHVVHVGENLLPGRGLENPEGPDDEYKHSGANGHPGASGEENRDEDDGKNTDPCTWSRISVATEGNIEVVLQPGREGHVPALPELPRIRRLIR